MKKIVLRLLTFIAILYLADSFINGFEFKTVGLLILLGLLLAFTEIVITPIINFFTLPINMLSLGVFNFVISCLYLYFFDLIIPGLSIVNGSIGPLSSEAIEIPTINLSKFGVVIVASLLIAVLNNIVSWTQEKKKDKK